MGNWLFKRAIWSLFLVCLVGLGVTWGAVPNNLSNAEYTTIEQIEEVIYEKFDAMLQAGVDQHKKEKIEMKKKEISDVMLQAKKSFKDATSETEKKNILQKTTHIAVAKTLAASANYKDVKNNLSDFGSAQKNKQAEESVIQSVNKESKKIVIIKSEKTKQELLELFHNFDADVIVKELFPTTFKVTIKKGSLLADELLGYIDQGEMPEKLLGVEVVQPEVFSIESTPILDGESVGDLRGLQRYNAGVYQEEFHTHTGVTVGIVDTGIDATHPDLAENISQDIAGYDFVNDDADPHDDHYHGTHVAGTIGASANGSGIFGVNSNASLVPLKICDANGMCPTYAIYDAIVYAADQGVQVLNMSLGGRVSSLGHPVCDAIHYATQQGTIVIAAAGNANDDVTYFVPGACANTITVGAVDANLNRASFSNYGVGVDISAPGVAIRSTEPGGGYRILDGTSMASPHIAGLVSAILGVDSETNYTTESMISLLQTSSSVVSTTPEKPMGSFAEANAIMDMLGIEPGAGGSGGVGTGSTGSGVVIVETIPTITIDMSSTEPLHIDLQAYDKVRLQVINGVPDYEMYTDHSLGIGSVLFPEATTVASVSTKSDGLIRIRSSHGSPIGPVDLGALPTGVEAENVEVASYYYGAGENVIMYGMWNVFSEMDFNLIIWDGNGTQRQVSVHITPPEPIQMEVGSEMNLSEFYAHFGDVYYLEISDTDRENIWVTDVATSSTDANGDVILSAVKTGSVLLRVDHYDPSIPEYYYSMVQVNILPVPEEVIPPEEELSLPPPPASATTVDSASFMRNEGNSSSGGMLLTSSVPYIELTAGETTNITFQGGQLYYRLYYMAGPAEPHMFSALPGSYVDFHVDDAKKKQSYMIVESDGAPYEMDDEDLLLPSEIPYLPSVDDATSVIEVFDEDIETQSQSAGQNLLIRAMEPGIGSFKVLDEAGNKIEIPVLVKEKVIYANKGDIVVIPTPPAGYVNRGYTVSGPTPQTFASYREYFNQLAIDIEGDGIFTVRTKLYSSEQNETFYSTFTIVAGHATYGDYAPQTLPSTVSQDGSLTFSEKNFTLNPGEWKDIAVEGGGGDYDISEYSLNRCKNVLVIRHDWRGMGVYASPERQTVRFLGLSEGRCDIYINSRDGSYDKIRITVNDNPYELRMQVGQPYVLYGRSGNPFIMIRRWNSREASKFSSMFTVEQGPNNSYILTPKQAGTLEIEGYIGQGGPENEQTYLGMNMKAIVTTAPVEEVVAGPEDVTLSEEVNFMNSHEKMVLYVGEMGEIQTMGGEGMYIYNNQNLGVSLSAAEGQEWDDLGIGEDGSFQIAATATPRSVRVLGLQEGTSTLRIQDETGATKNIEVTVLPQPIQITPETSLVLEAKPPYSIEYLHISDESLFSVQSQSPNQYVCVPSRQGTAVLNVGVYNADEQRTQTLSYTIHVTNLPGSQSNTLAGLDLSDSNLEISVGDLVSMRVSGGYPPYTVNVQYDSILGTTIDPNYQSDDITLVTMPSEGLFLSATLPEEQDNNNSDEPVVSSIGEIEIATSKDTPQKLKKQGKLDYLDLPVSTTIELLGEDIETTNSNRYFRALGLRPGNTYITITDSEGTKDWVYADIGAKNLSIRSSVNQNIVTQVDSKDWFTIEKLWILNSQMIDINYIGGGSYTLTPQVLEADVTMYVTVSDNVTGEEFTLEYELHISQADSGDDIGDGDAVVDDPTTTPGEGSEPLTVDKLDIITEVGDVVEINITGGNPGASGYVISLGSDAIVPLPNDSIGTQSVNTFATVIFQDGNTYSYPVDPNNPNTFKFLVVNDGDYSLEVSDSNLSISQAQSRNLGIIAGFKKVDLLINEPTIVFSGIAEDVPLVDFNAYDYLGQVSSDILSVVNSSQGTYEITPLNVGSTTLVVTFWSESRGVNMSYVILVNVKYPGSLTYSYDMVSSFWKLHIAAADGHRGDGVVESLQGKSIEEIEVYAEKFANALYDYFLLNDPQFKSNHDAEAQSLLDEGEGTLLSIEEGLRAGFVDGVKDYLMGYIDLFGSLENLTLEGIMQSVTNVRDLTVEVVSDPYSLLIDMVEQLDVIYGIVTTFGGGEKAKASSYLSTNLSLNIYDPAGKVIGVLGVGLFGKLGKYMDNIGPTIGRHQIGNLKFTDKPFEHMNNPSRSVPTDYIETAVQGTKYPDPQGSIGGAYYKRILMNGKEYNMKVIYIEETNTVLHFHYTPKAVGPLEAIQ